MLNEKMLNNKLTNINQHIASDPNRYLPILKKSNLFGSVKCQLNIG